jgi:hypothetical protein
MLGRRGICEIEQYLPLLCLRTSRSDPNRVCKETTKFEVRFVVVVEKPVFVDVTENYRRAEVVSLLRW